MGSPLDVVYVLGAIVLLFLIAVEIYEGRKI